MSFIMCPLSCSRNYKDGKTYLKLKTYGLSITHFAHDSSTVEHFEKWSAIKSERSKWSVVVWLSDTFECLMSMVDVTPITSMIKPLRCAEGTNLIIDISFEMGKEWGIGITKWISLISSHIHFVTINGRTESFSLPFIRFGLIAFIHFWLNAYPHQMVIECHFVFVRSSWPRVDYNKNTDTHTHAHKENTNSQSYSTTWFIAVIWGLIILATDFC